MTAKTFHSNLPQRTAPIQVSLLIDAWSRNLKVQIFMVRVKTNREVRSLIFCQETVTVTGDSVYDVIIISVKTEEEIEKHLEKSLICFYTFGEKY